MPVTQGSPPRREALDLKDGIRSEPAFDDIVGESAALKHVLSQARMVARTDTTVLILGETGTGKELIARAIHRISSRREASFIKSNCAAIPGELVESELFGYEKGAFTGAVARKLGRLELADKGTLFLDEIAEFPIDVQPKLLRVLEDQEFERLGSTQTVRVNMRLITATNQDLMKMVDERRFRIRPLPRLAAEVVADHGEVDTGGGADLPARHGPIPVTQK